MSTGKFIGATVALVALAACDGGIARPDIGAMYEPEVTRRVETAPPGASPGTCWGKHVSPAIIETVTEQVMLQPAEIMADGTVMRPAVYKTETRQAIVKERIETWFQTPCAPQMTPDVIASLQRALKARGHYYGPINGQMTTRTRAAVRRYQEPQGLDSGILSLEAARRLGLIAVERDLQ